MLPGLSLLICCIQGVCTAHKATKTFKNHWFDMFFTFKMCLGSGLVVSSSRLLHMVIYRLDFCRWLGGGSEASTVPSGWLSGILAGSPAPDSTSTIGRC